MAGKEPLDESLTIRINRRIKSDLSRQGYQAGMKLSDWVRHVLSVATKTKQRRKDGTGQKPRATRETGSRT